MAYAYTLDQQIYYEDSTVNEDQLQQIDPAYVAHLMLAMSKSDHYQSILNNFPISINSHVNSAYRAIIMSIWFQSLAIDSETWKWDLFNEMVVFAQSDDIIKFLEHTDYVSYSLGGLLIHQHPEALAKIPKRVRATMSDKIEEKFMLPFDYIAVGHLREVDLEYEDLRDSDPITYYTLEIDNEPGYSYNYIQRAEARVEFENDYQGAIEDITQALLIDPSDADYYFKRAYYRYYLNDFENSILDYDSAIMFDPENNTAWSNRGLMKKNLQRCSEAIDDFTRAIELDSSETKYYLNRAQCHAELGNYNNTISDLTYALVIDPEDESLLLNRAYYLMEVDDYEGSIADYDRVLSSGYQNPEAYSNKAYAYYKLSEYDSAIKYYDIASEYNEENATLNYNLAVMYGEKEDYINAIREYNIAIEKRPDYAEAFANKAWAYRQLNMKDSACVNYKFAATLGHDGLEDDIQLMCNN